MGGYILGMQVVLFFESEKKGKFENYDYENFLNCGGGGVGWGVYC